MTKPSLRIAMGQQDTIGALEELQRKVAAGECSSFAIRVFKADGTWEDIAAGGTAEEQEEALADLRRAYSDSH